MEDLTVARARWLACRAKSCCSRGAKNVTGADIVRIARTLALEPWHFTQTAPAAADDPAGIVLDAGRRRVTLTLANAVQGCVFLLRTGGGGSCCGLGDFAPVSCQVFPADPTVDEPAVRADAGFQCREWTNDDLDRDVVAESSRTWTADQAHWHEVVRRWNVLAANTRAGPPDIEDFQRYLLEAQAAREIGAAWPEEVRA